MGAYGFAWGFGFLQFLLEFGMSSALQRQVSDTLDPGRPRRGRPRDRLRHELLRRRWRWSRPSRCWRWPTWRCRTPSSRATRIDLIVKLLWLQALTAPCFGLSTVVSSVLQAARRYDFIPRFELVIVILRFAILWAGPALGVDFFLVVAAQTVVQIGLSLGPGAVGHGPRAGVRPPLPRGDARRLRGA